MAVDFAGGGGDLTGGGGDLTGGGTTMSVNWMLFNQNLQGQPNNAFAINCDDPSVNATTLVFSAVNGASVTKTTMGACPAGMSSGAQVINLPDPNGPFTISAVIQGKPASNSDKIKNVTPGLGVTVSIYAAGCDMPQCQ